MRTDLVDASLAFQRLSVDLVFIEMRIESVSDSPLIYLSSHVDKNFFWLGNSLSRCLSSHLKNSCSRK